MTITVFKLDHRPPPGIKPWKYRVTRPKVGDHNVDMGNLQPTLDILKHLEEIREAVVALFPDATEDRRLTRAFTEIIERLEGETADPDSYSDAEHLKDEINDVLNLLYGWCDDYRVLLSIAD